MIYQVQFLHGLKIRGILETVMRTTAHKPFVDPSLDKQDSEYLRQKLKLKSLEIKNNFNRKFPHVTKFFRERGLGIENLREHSAKLIGAGALTGTLLLSAPVGLTSPLLSEIIQTGELPSAKSDVPQKDFTDILNSVLPEKTRPLTVDEEKKIEILIKRSLGVKVKATLEGEHLNTVYGLIGAEQHLRRFPGDTLSYHGRGTILSEGMAGGLGAWGYFAPSKTSFTPDLEETEKWYSVVQTLYLPDWGKRQPYLQKWYKYRKVLIVNTLNGQAVVSAIADSGPAVWTGKSFGGSPEVMDYLGGVRYKKGPVLLFFVDDPENRMPLGPVDYNKVRIPFEKT